MSAHEEDKLRFLADKHLKNLKTEEPATDFMNKVMQQVHPQPIDHSVFIYKSPISKTVWAIIALAFTTLVIYINKSEIALTSLAKWIPVKREMSVFQQLSLRDSVQLPYVVMAVIVIFTLLTLLEIPLIKRLVNHNH